MTFKDVLRGVGDVIVNNKLLTFLSVALFAFVIATIALASENNSNANALGECESRLWTATSVTPGTTTVVPADTTTVTGAPTSTDAITTPEAATTTTTVIPDTTQAP
ncbi:uncharacterized protein LOC131676257 [Topomyia yanbarensis]|uniref:uncharacterized protein LOC131676257 n=1 Tax=Topomyia yanbarensis TaxID=2498891 RepID=UPI00273B008C|nr:uncharacterized protein LOC131676257 [Topomyia yanbarensis]